MPGAFIGAALSADVRRALSKTLARILPGTPEQQVAFLDAVELEIGAYRKLLVPLHADGRAVPDDLQRLAQAARKFAKAVDLANPQTIALLEQIRQTKVDNKAREFAPVIRLAKDMDHAVQLLEFLQQPWPLPVRIAGFWAADVAARAESYLKRADYSPSRPGPSAGGDAALIGLVRNLAAAYSQVFRKPPSAAREGRFAKALSEILKKVGVSVEDEGGAPAIGETRLYAILTTGGFAPKKQPRVRRN
jgi:hypothetical protein